MDVSLRLDHPASGCTCHLHSLIRREGRVERNITLQFRWYRSARRRACSGPCVRGKWRPAELQCLRSERRFCGAGCFAAAWTSAERRCPSSALVRWDDERRCPEIAPFVEDAAWELLAGAESDTYVPTPKDVGFALKAEVEFEGETWSVESDVVIDGRIAPFRRSVHSGPAAGMVGGTSLRVVTYNILAPAYATRQMYPYTPLWAIAWEYRRNLILSELRSYKADVIALQEMQADHFQGILSELSQEGFDGIFKSKTRKGRGKVDGCALLYRKAKFAVLEVHEIEYNSSAMQAAANGAFHNQARTQSALKRLLRDNVGHAVVFEVRGTKQRVCVANSHLYWDPEYADVKLWQTHTLTLELERIVSSNLQQPLPLLLCGDFNSTPDSTVVQLLGEGRVDPKHRELTPSFDPCEILPSVDMMSHSLELFSAYPAVVGEYAITNFTGTYKGVLDYIWASREYFAALRTMRLPTERELLARDDTPLPNSQFPSDHLAICVDFLLNYDG